MASADEAESESASRIRGENIVEKMSSYRCLQNDLKSDFSILIRSDNNDI